MCELKNTSKNEENATTLQMTDNAHEYGVLQTDDGKNILNKLI
jgi:hypothetical protein